MSFSTKVKEELTRHIGSARHCRIAEIAAFINMCGEIKENEQEEVIGLKIQTENPAVARKCFTLLTKTFNIKVEVSIRRSRHLKKHRVYSVYVMNQQEAIDVLNVTKLLKNGKTTQQINPMIVQTACCRRSYVRGAFLASGSMSDPKKTYHLEFVNQNETHAHELMNLVNSFEMESKIVIRKKYFVVYLKEGRQIVDLLNVMEAHIALMDLENLRILKEMRNNVNRIVNCETANIGKTVSAAVKQLKDIEYVDQTIGLSALPKSIEEVVRVRIENPDASLKELGKLLDPEVGKSGVNHRLRKLSHIVEKLKSIREEFHD